MTPRIVIKLGGSLLSHSSTPSTLRSLLDDSFKRHQVFLIVGGGELVEAVRDLDAVHSFAQEMLHWVSVDLMGSTMTLVSQWFKDADVIESQEQLAFVNASGIAGLCLVMPSAFYRRGDQRLPQNWGTTSDSIAAILAVQLGIKDLVLLKSCMIDETIDGDLAAERQVVDSHFPTVAKDLCVRLIGFKSTIMSDVLQTAISSDGGEVDTRLV